MNRLKMRKLLWKGVNAVEVSIMKWKDIKNLTGSDKGERNCGLCYKYESPTCYKCPLKQIGKGCREFRSPYAIFTNSSMHSTKQAAINGMIKALEEARVYEITGQKPVKVEAKPKKKKIIKKVKKDE